MKTLFAVVALLATVAMPALASAADLNITVGPSVGGYDRSIGSGPVSWVVIVPVDNPRVPLAMTSEWEVRDVYDNREQCHKRVREHIDFVNRVIAANPAFAGTPISAAAILSRFRRAKCRSTQEAVAVGSVGTFGQ